MTDNEIIKNCPFCGGKGKLQFFYNDHTIYCSKCGASARMFYPTKKEALEAWNNRVDNDLINRQKAEIERLQKELEIKTQKRVNMYERLDAFERGKSKGRKVFAERLKNKVAHIPAWGAVAEAKIDNLLEEMEGGGNK